MPASHFFSQAAQWTSRQCGRPLTFGLAVAIVLVWAVTGPMFNYSDTWQLVINTGTTIVTFLMVFLIQNTQNRDAAAVQLKLDELIRASATARNRLLTLEDLSEKELDQLKASFAQSCHAGRHRRGPPAPGGGGPGQCPRGFGESEGQYSLRQASNDCRAINRPVSTRRLGGQLVETGARQDREFAVGKFFKIGFQ